MPDLALLEPDRPHNLGGILRLAACLGIAVHVIEPAGFPLDDRRIREAALDYAPLAPLVRHAGLPAFLAHARAGARRLVLLTTRGDVIHTQAGFRPDDLVILGREGSGAPAALHAGAALRVRVPMRAPARSLNIVAAAALVIGEALRQTGAFDMSGQPP